MKNFFVTLVMLFVISCGKEEDPASEASCKALTAVWSNAYAKLDLQMLTLDEDNRMNFVINGSLASGILHMKSTGEYAFCEDVDRDNHCDDIDEDEQYWPEDQDSDDIITGIYIHDCNELTFISENTIIYN